MNIKVFLGGASNFSLTFASISNKRTIKSNSFRYWNMLLWFYLPATFLSTYLLHFSHSLGNNVRAAKSNFTSSCVLLRMQKKQFCDKLWICRCSNSSIEKKYLINFLSHTQNIFFTSTSNKYWKKRNQKICRDERSLSFFHFHIEIQQELIKKK